MNKILCGNCLEVMKDFKDNTFDSVVTDPPYGLRFMGKGWDHGVPGVDYWKEVLRVAKPGAFLLAFGGTRTFHRLAVAIEDAGWEMRDTVGWIYGSGFPKSHNVGKAVDKLQGNEREVTGKSKGRSSAIHGGGQSVGEDDILTKGTSEWEGWGTALKPAWEPIIMARKPLAEKTVADNVLKYGTGGINVDECRVGTDVVKTTAHKTLGDGIKYGKSKPFDESEERIVRFPANIIHDGREEVMVVFPNGSSRFFYCAKASKQDRDECNNHPTVKPTKLMRYLVKLVTRKGGLVLDPFCGSGSTCKACVLEGCNYVGIDLDPEYCKIAENRTNAISIQTKLW